MPSCGPAITHHELDLHTVQVYADGDPLVQLRRDPLRWVWLLPYPGVADDELVFRTPAKALKQIVWDAEHLSHTKFAQIYHGFVPCVARKIDDTTWVVDRAGTRLADIVRDASTHRWVIFGPGGDRVRVQAVPGGWNYPEAAAEHVLSNVAWFLIDIDAAGPIADTPDVELDLDADALPTQEGTSDA